MSELMSEERLSKFLTESCCQHGEACNSIYASEVRAELARLRAENERLTRALHEISLCSQNSMSSKRECGRIAMRTLNHETTSKLGDFLNPVDYV